MEGNYSLKQYNSGLTQLVEESNDYIIRHLKSMVQNENYDNLLDYLNDSENLITPAFILKRQIQEVYSDILEKASDSLGFEIRDLTESENGSWMDEEPKEKKLVLKLSELLPSRILEETSVIWNRFENYLLGKLPTKRDIILMLASAFQMDEITLTKFLLSCSKHELNVYNPMDYIYLFCQKMQKGSPVQWSKVAELLKKYEDGIAEIKQDEDEVTDAEHDSDSEIADEDGDKPDKQIDQSSWTYMLTNQLSEITGEYEPESERDNLVSEKKLIEFMILNHDKFTSILYRKRTNVKGEKVNSKKGQYIEGASRTRRKNLYNLSRVLVCIYPSYSADLIKNDKYLKDGRETKDTRHVSVSVDKEGYPNLSQLVKSMTAAHAWDFMIDESCSQSSIKTSEHKDGSIGLARTQKKIIYDTAPFRKYVYLYCKGFNAKIRKIKNNDTAFQNTEPIDRQDILYLGYMFISGFMMLEMDAQDELCDKIQDSYGQDPFIDKIIHIMERLMDIQNNALDEYQACLSLFLNAFSFGELYLPLVFDRFVLLALLGERESGDITWTKDLMEEGYWSNIDELEET